MLLYSNLSLTYSHTESLTVLSVSDARVCYVGYDYTSGDNFNYHLDLGSFTTVVALNNNILNPTDLLYIGKFPYVYG